MNGIKEIVADKGYHSGQSVILLGQAEVRTYIPEPNRGRRHWVGKAEEQQAVYGNRRRVQGRHGKHLLKRRGELIERSFAHCYETGGMRRTHLRGRENILKRQLIHVCAFNLSLIFRQVLGAGTCAGAPKSRPRSICGVYPVTNRLTTAPAGRRGPPTASAPPKSASRTRLPSVASFSENRGLYHRLLVLLGHKYVLLKLGRFTPKGCQY